MPGKPEPARVRRGTAALGEQLGTHALVACLLGVCGLATGHVPAGLLLLAIGAGGGMAILEFRHRRP